MLDKFTYKQKTRGLLGITAVFAILIWSLALKNTVDLAVQCGELEEKMKVVETAPIKIAQLKNELAAVESLLGKGNDDNESFQQVLLEEVSKYCNENNIVLKNFPEPWVKKEQEYLVETNPVVVEGNFVQLLKLSYELEQKQRLARVAGLQFLVNTELRTKRRRLVASIYLQNIKKLGQ